MSLSFCVRLVSSYVSEGGGPAAEEDSDLEVGSGHDGSIGPVLRDLRAVLSDHEVCENVCGRFLSLESGARLTCCSHSVTAVN